MRCTHFGVVGVIAVATTSPLSATADPAWEPFGLDTLSVYDLHRAGPFLYACTAEGHDGVWRRDVVRSAAAGVYFARVTVGRSWVQQKVTVLR